MSCPAIVVCDVVFPISIAFQTVHLRGPVKSFFRVHVDGVATRTVLDLAAHTYPYDTDGLIFTPAALPVGGRFHGDECAVDGTWHQLLKWKPSEFNTVDAIVRRNSLGDVDGRRVFTMMCAYVPRDWEPIDVMRYVRFKERALPSETPLARPFDVAGDLGHLRVPLDNTGRPLTEDGDVVYDSDVVECRYAGGEWIAMRARPDKSARAKGGKIAGAANNWSTALAAWTAVRFPVSENVIRRLEDSPEDIGPRCESYYARRNFSRRRSMLRNMTDFHNNGVKRALYNGGSRSCIGHDRSFGTLWHTAAQV